MNHCKSTQLNTGCFFPKAGLEWLKLVDAWCTGAAFRHHCEVVSLTDLMGLDLQKCRETAALIETNALQETTDSCSLPGLPAKYLTHTDH